MKVRLFKIRIAEEHLVLDQNRLDDFLIQNEILKFETAFVNDKQPFWSVIITYNNTTDESVFEVINKDYHAQKEVDFNKNEEKLLESLKLWRSDKAKEQNLPSYCIASNHALISVVKNKPTKMEDLHLIKGFGKHKIENYGNDIIDLITEAR